MTKDFSLKQLFSLVDGRLSTNIGDVYDMLNHICDTELMTHHLPIAMNYVKLKNPFWFNVVKNTLDTLECNRTKEFSECIQILNKSEEPFRIPQLKDEFDTSDFSDFMVDNSLLARK